MNSKKIGAASRADNVADARAEDGLPAFELAEPLEREISWDSINDVTRLAVDALAALRDACDTIATLRASLKEMDATICKQAVANMNLAAELRDRDDLDG